MSDDHTEYDVIIIGAGLAGGLPAGAYLQKAGARVLMVEANNEAGTHAKTHEYFGGAVCTPCAGGFVGGTSPYWGDLELEKYGAEMLVNNRGFSMLFPDNTSIGLGPADLEGAMASIMRYSKKDAETVQGMMMRTMEVFVELNELVFFSPPSPEKIDVIYEKAAYISGIPVEEFVEMTSFEFLDYMFESDKLKQYLFVPTVATWVTGDPNARGSGAVEMLVGLCAGFGQIKGTNNMLVHAFIRVFHEYGGTLWKNTKVSKIVIEDGVAVGITLADDAVMHPGETIRANSAVISNAGAKATLPLIGESEMKQADSRLYNKMKYWDMASRPSCVTVWVLDKPPKFKAAETDPYMNRADWIFKGFPSLNDWKAWGVEQRSGNLDEAFGGWWEFFIGSHIDPTQAGPDGHVTLRIEEVLPYYLRDDNGKLDAQRWEDEKWTLVRRREDMIEEWAPGFKDSIKDVVASSPVDLWRSNVTAVNGCAQGGGVLDNQQVLGRMPYRMPIKNLYMSNSVYPASLSWGASGYNAACVVAEDMGIRNQPWWVHRPGEWFLQNLPRLLIKAKDAA